MMSHPEDSMGQELEPKRGSTIDIRETRLEIIKSILSEVRAIPGEYQLSGILSAILYFLALNKMSNESDLAQILFHFLVANSFLYIGIKLLSPSRRNALDELFGREDGQLINKDPLKSIERV